MNRALGLDISRTIAIVLVLIHHLAQMCLPHIDAIHPYTSLGKYGVDVFFGLSGFLIGGLYWSELKSNGNVDTFRFILKRSFRTVPPYYIALSLSFFSVWIFRDEVFRFEYLFFIQNYLDKIPYFLVSWSLCIEEHFYVALPIIVFIVNRFIKNLLLYILIFLSLHPLIFRTFQLNEMNTDFGYYLTATHLHYEGLIFGVILSYYAYYKPRVYESVVNNRYIWLIISIALLMSMSIENSIYNYSIGLYLMRLFFALSIMGFSKIYIDSKYINSFFEIISKSTYSIYLVHGIIIHFTIYCGRKLGLGNWEILCLSIVFIGFATVLFYRLIDKNVLKLRSKFF